jgi:catalase
MHPTQRIAASASAEAGAAGISRRSLIQTAGLSISGALVSAVSTTAGAAPAPAAAPASADDRIEELSREVTDALEGAYGRHAGKRRNHAKGVGALGRFIGDPGAARYSRSSLFSGAPIEVVARFSLAGGDPTAADFEKSTRGLALEFRLPRGELHHMTMLNTPMFFASMPKTFLDRFMALKADQATGKPDPAQIRAFVASHPDFASQAHFLAEHNPPPSFANSAFFGIHTFRFIDRDDRVTMVRFRFVPRDGEKRMSDAALAAAPRDFLVPALFDRMKQGPIEWDMLISLGEPGDPVDDPTLPWPANRREVRGGRLVLDRACADALAGSYRINYDPLMMADGIAPTHDPILLFRSPSYALSHERRLREGSGGGEAAVGVEASR